MRHTKIIATLGPSTESEEAIAELVAAGVDIFRLNFSHGTHDTHSALYRRVRDAADRSGRVVAVLQDLSGPKIRIGALEGGMPVELEPGNPFTISTGEFAGNSRRVATTYAELARAVRPGDRLLLDDGRIEVRVVETDGTEIETVVVNGGTLGERKGINAPRAAFPARTMTMKDVEDARFGVRLGVDMVAISFVHTAADLQRARAVLAEAGDPAIPLVAKIERPEAVANIDEILAACEAVMVARGDLGLELPLERVPGVQKDITRRSRARGLPVIVATQVLESMRSEPRPTRAEVSDAANAVDDGVDAIMLAGETAAGAFPIRAVQTLDAVIREAEAIRLPGGDIRLDLDEAGHELALCEAAVTLARVGRADAIVAVTRAGQTARLLAALRPQAAVYAVTDSETTARRLTLFHGVVPFVVPIGADVDSTGAAIERHLLTHGLLAPGAVAVLVSVNPDLRRGDANFLKLQRLGGL